MAVVSLLLLRVALGWFFLAGAWHKYYDKGFSSEPFLRQAKGPLAPLYQSWIPDFHDWGHLIEAPLRQEPNPDEKLSAQSATQQSPEAQEKARQWNERSYNDWLKKIIEDWGHDEQRIAAHFGFDPAQQAKAGIWQTFYVGKLKAYLAARADDLAAYRHDLYRMTKIKPQPEIPADADMETRKGAAQSVRSDVEQMEQQYRTELESLATDAQRATHGELPREASPVSKLDRFIIYAHLAIGFCLVAGLLTRLASLGGAVFLLSVVASQPWWAEGALGWTTGPQAVMYQVCLMLACLVLMGTGAGRWAGLDYFFARRREPISSQKEPA